MVKVVSHPFPGVTLTEWQAKADRTLQLGEKFRVPEGEDPTKVWEVVAIGQGSAVVRAAGKKRSTYTGKVFKTKSVNGRKYKVDTGETREVEFSKPEAGKTVSLRSFVERVGG